MEKLKIDIVSLDDWEALYVNDELQEQNHSVNMYDLLMLLAAHGVIEFNAYDEEYWDASYEAYDHFGGFPGQLGEYTEFVKEFEAKGESDD